MNAYTDALHGRHGFTSGVRNLADWLEADTTRPAPEDLLVGIRLNTAADVETFARVHELGEVYVDAHGQSQASARFGPVIYRVYSPARENCS